MDPRLLLLTTALQEYLCIRPMRSTRNSTKRCDGTRIPAVRHARLLGGPRTRLINFDDCLSPDRSIILAIEPCHQ